MSILEITKLNEVYLKINCESYIQKELSEYFTFQTPNSKHDPRVKAKKWDGKIRLFALRQKTLYVGLLPYLETFCADRDYTIKYTNDDLSVEDEFSKYHADKFIDSLKLHSDDKPLSPRDYQIDALMHVMQARRALVISPTSSGKSLILYMIFRQLLDYKNLKGLLIVPSSALVKQLTGDFGDYSSHNGFDVSGNIHQIYDGAGKITDKKLTISTWQALYEMPKEFFDQFDYVIGDEAHTCTAQSVSYILSSCVNAKYRVGVTGTIKDTQVHKLVLEGLFGKLKQFITTKELMDRKEVSDLMINCLILNYDEVYKKLIYKKPYEDEIDFLISHPARNKFIKNLALSLNNNTLILYKYVDRHGEILYNMIKDSEKIGNRKVFFIHGDVGTNDREEIRRIFEKETNAIIIGSTGTVSTGTNIKNLHNIIFAHPSKSKILTLQSIGRELRLHKSKEQANLYDISDDLRYKDKMNYTLKHFVERVKIYNEEKFPFKIYKIGLK